MIIDHNNLQTFSPEERTLLMMFETQFGKKAQSIKVRTVMGSANFNVVAPVGEALGIKLIAVGAAAVAVVSGWDEEGVNFAAAAYDLAQSFNDSLFLCKEFGNGGANEILFLCYDIK